MFQILLFIHNKLAQYVSILEKIQGNFLSNKDFWNLLPILNYQQTVPLKFP
jgi:hypothetical protein